MSRSVAVLTAFVVFGSGSVALAAGPTYVSQGGLGVLARDGKTRYVAVPTGNGTAIERVRVNGGAVSSWADLRGSWGIPAPTYSPTGGEGLTRPRRGTGEPLLCSSRPARTDGCVRVGHARTAMPAAARYALASATVCWP